MAKCEFFLPGGSMKDRIAKRMIEDAEKKGLIKPGVSTIIEATSGNTGIGLALNGAVKGYDVIITLPEKMSQEKSDVLSALGAEIIRTPTEASFVDIDSHIGVARKLNKQIENSIILDQYCNPSNALVHYDETAEEIWAQCEGKIDYMIVSAGTGGSITGISRKLKEKNPNIQIIGVDPKGSILAYPDEVNKGGITSYKVEGIGYDFIPKNCDRTGNIDRWVKCEDYPAFRMSRRLIKEEGLLVGGSCGCVMQAAIEIAKDLPEDKRVVCLFVDSIRNYMTKFLNDDWMLENGFFSQEEYDRKNFPNNLRVYGNEYTVADLELPEVRPVYLTSTVNDVIAEFNLQGVECLPVLNDASTLIGIVTKANITTLLTTFKITLDSFIPKALMKEFKKVSISDSLKYLSKAFKRHQFLVVTGEKGKYFICENKHLLNHFLKNNK